MFPGFARAPWAIVFAATISITPLLADLTVAPPASDAMVVQRGAPLPLAGTARPSEDVSISFAGEIRATRAGADGKWQIEFPPTIDPGGPHVLVIQSGGEAIRFANVLVGDVWFCSGQSNMQYPLRVIAPEEIPHGDVPNLRILSAERISSRTPLAENPARWEVCQPETLPEFSATAYFFGKALAAQSGVPIGLISSSWGGKKAESFTRREPLLAHPDLKPLVDRWDAAMAAYPEALKDFQANGTRRWEELNKSRVAKGLKPAAPPRPPAGLDAPEGPGNLWNGMIHPFVALPVTGFLWYQGESNAQFAEQYRPLLKTMITDWRDQWNQPEAPFYVVQLAGYMPRYGQQYKFLAANPQKKPPPLESEWAELRESQAAAAELPNVALATAIDIGDAKDIHPKAKPEVGRRLSLLALNRVYGKPIEDQGPVFESMKILGSSVEIRFAHADGLRANGDDPPAGFALAGADRRFHWATAAIRGNSVILSAPDVPAPIAARYGWEDFPSANLVNSANLPAFPFRTDSWPGITAGKR